MQNVPDRSAILTENREEKKKLLSRLIRRKLIPSGTCQREDAVNKFSRPGWSQKELEGIRLARNEHAVIPLETILNIFYLPPRGISQEKTGEEASLSARFPNSPRSKQ